MVRKRMRRVFGILILAAVIFFGGYSMLFGMTEKKVYEADTEAFGNPLMGYAPGTSSDAGEDVTLRYVDITWRELEPREGFFDWKSLEESDHLEEYRRQGVHLVLRFLCDLPGDETHTDLPDWLMERTGDGDWYDMEYGKGYSPDYSNPDLIACHNRAVAELGRYLGQDGFVSFVELGSLGHWGEWHVNYDEGIRRLPEEKVRNLYVLPWAEAFPNAKILMRRPFAIARDCKFGVYNDMSGHPESTEEWLDWISNGAVYHQTGEKNTVVSMPEFWRTAPAGGELTSSLSMEEMLDKELQRTVSLLERSHATFLGPKTASREFEQGYREVLKTLGYRLSITQAVLQREWGQTKLTLSWTNEGAAPFYWDWPVRIYVEDLEGNTLEVQEIPLHLTQLQPKQVINTSVLLEEKGLFHRQKSGKRITVGILDPMTGKDCVRFAMKAERETNGRTVLFGV